MRAGSDAVTLPHTFRPLGVRLAAYSFGGMLFVVAAVVWFAFPPEIRDEFNWVQRLTVLALGGVVAAAGYGLARSRVEARSEGVTVVNGFKTQRFDWNEIVAVTLRPGSPWALLDLSDGTSAAAMGIQASDGARATTQLRQLRRLIEQQTRTERND